MILNFPQLQYDVHREVPVEIENKTKRMHIQGLLKLLWTVYSEGKLQSCLKLRNFQNPFDKDKSVGL